MAAGACAPAFLWDELSMKMDRRGGYLGISSLLLFRNRIKCIKKKQSKRGNTMCEFEGVCIFEDGEECDKNNPTQCPNWVIMAGELGEEF